MSLEILDALYSLGLVDPSIFNTEKLINSNIKYYKETLLILNDLNFLLQNKMISNYSNIDDIFSLDLMTSNATQFQPNDQNYFDELFSKKIQLFDDSMFFKEYKAILTPNSLVPSDLNRIVKNINENSSYFDHFHYNKFSNKEELIEFLTKELSNLESQIDSAKNLVRNL